MTSQHLSEPPLDAVAIVGMAGRFPGAPSIAAYADLLWSGREGITRFDPAEAESRPLGEPISGHPDFVPAAAALEGIEEFDAAAFGLSAREALLLDPQHRLFLECAAECLDDAAIDPQRFAGRIGVFGGCGISSYLLHSLIPTSIIQQADPLEVMMGCDKDFLATRVAYQLDLTGPAITVQSACSTSLLAVHVAAQSLLNRECDAVLAGGVTITTPQRLGYVFHPSGIRSPDGRCRPFDAKAAGTVFGSGVGVILLRPLRDALDAGDPIRAVIRATASNNDGKTKVGFTAPSVEGQTDVLGEALALSGLPAESIGYIEAHGTATPMGDPIEVSAIRDVYGATDGNAPPCILGSVKSNVGHLDAASGIAGLIKTVLCLERGTVPPTVHFEVPNPELGIEGSRFRVSAKVESWPVAGPRRAAVSSFGVGGTNVHAVLEQAPERSRHAPGDRTEPQLLPLSAMSEEALVTTARRLADVAQSFPLADLARTLQDGRTARKVRAAVVARPDTVTDTLGIVNRGRASAGRPRIAFLFAGQGSQYPGMARPLAERYPAFRTALETCLAGFRQSAGIDLAPLILDAEVEDTAAAEALRRTSTAQAAIFSHSIACASLWQSLGIEPEVLLGHSIGEWAAAVMSGVVALPDAIALVAKRGALMQAAPEGAMLAVPLAETECTALLGENVDLAAVNGSALCVLSGPRPALQHISATCPEGKWLRTSHAFHSRSMAEAAESFAREVARVTLSPPRIPVLSSRTGRPLTDAEAMAPDYWGGQVRHTVRFHLGLRSMTARADAVVECGPGDGLSGLAALAFTEEGRHDTVCMATAPAMRTAAEGAANETFLKAVGALWETGATVDWAALRGPAQGRRLRLPATAFNRHRHWPGSPNQSARTGNAAGIVSMPAAPSEAVTRPDLSPLDLMCRLWAETLAMREVQADQKFIDLGGTSVIAMQLVARCAAHGLKVKAADVLALQTPRALLAAAAPPASATPLHTAATRPALTAEQILAVAEGGNKAVVLRAASSVSPERALAKGRHLAATPILRMRVVSSWQGTEVSLAPAGEVPLLTADSPFTTVSPEQGISGCLAVRPGKAEDGCILEVTLHPAAGGPVEALCLLNAWKEFCTDSLPTDAIPGDLATCRHAPVSKRLEGESRRGVGPGIRHGSVSVPAETLTAWTELHATGEGTILAASAVLTVNTPEATRVTLLAGSGIDRAFSLPPLPPHPRLDDVVLGLKMAVSPQGAPLPVAPPDGVSLFWLGDLGAYGENDAVAILDACAQTAMPEPAAQGWGQTRTAAVLARHGERCLVTIAGNDPAHPPERLLAALLDALAALPAMEPSPAYALALERFTATNAPYADVRILFGLENAHAA